MFTSKLLIIALFSQLLIINLFAENKKDDLRKASRAYSRLMESAHPTPEYKWEISEGIPLAEENNPSLFLNVNTIAPETGTNQMQNESSIAVNPKNPKVLIAAAVDYRENSSRFVYISNDGGKTWINKNLGQISEGWRSSNDPSVAFDPDGVGYLVYGGFGELGQGSILFGENGVFLSKTTDNGATWETHIPVIIHEGQQTLDSTFEDKYYISVDYNENSPYYKQLYIPWKRVTPVDSATQIVISKSTDKGETWSAPVNVSDRISGSSEDTTFGQSFPLAASGPDGTLYVVWNQGIAHGVGFAKSEDGGKTFSKPRIIHNYNIFGKTILIEGQGYRHSVKGAVRAEAYPVITTDAYGSPHEGNVYVCWSADSIPNIYFSKSTDKGETWSEPFIINTDRTSDHFWPWMSIDPTNGDLAIIYFDSRNDPENILVDCYISYSSDGGETWLERRASDFSSDLRRNPFRANSFAGDYNGCAFYNGVIYPSWVDMRHAVENIFDSDVYTAIINISAPNPPDNFKAEIFPEKPASLKLSWEAPTERVFGQPLNPDEFHYSLYRNEQYLTDIPSDITVYLDSNLTPFELYKYHIVTVADVDTSNSRQAESYPGGAKQPDTPMLISARGNENNELLFSAGIPSVRADKTTPLVNLSELELFTDSYKVNSYNLVKTDTAKTINKRFSSGLKGFYDISVKITSKYDNPEFGIQESEMSNIITTYTGIVVSAFSENFDSDPLNKYYFGNNWGIANNFYRSAPNSITESPSGDYESNSKDTLIIFPFLNNKGADYKPRLTFWHAAIVQKRDSAVVEYSTDNMKSWTELGWFNKEMFEPWGDNELNNDDWKKEEFIIDSKEDDTVYVRFRFFSNFASNNDGWYIDDISIETVSSVAEVYDKDKIIIYPDPCTDYVTIYINYINKINEINIYNISGEKLTGQTEFNYSGNYITANVSSLDPGMYFARISSDSGIETVKFIVYR